MSDWRTFKLEEVSDFINGKAFYSDGYAEEGYRVIDLLNITRDGRFQLSKKDKYISKETYDKYPKVHLLKDDLLIIMTDITPDLILLGKTAIVPRNGYILNQRVGCIRIKDKFKEKISVKFLTNLINSDEVHHHFYKAAIGTAQYYFNTPDVKKCEISLPSLKEQSKIADIISSVDRVIGLTEVEIEKLKNLKKGMMQDLLTKGIGHTKFKDSPIGKIPESWECLNFSDAKVKIEDGDRGTNYPKADDFYDYEHCLFLSATNVTNTGFVFEKKQFITKEKDELLRKGKLVRGDIILTTRGTVGNIAYFDASVPFEHIRINSGMVIIRNTNRNLLNDFLYIAFKEYSFNFEFQKVVSGSAQPQLPITDLKKFHFVIPSKEEQQKIIDSYVAINSKLSSKITKLSKLKDMKKGLMQDLLTGKVRVKV